MDGEGGDKNPDSQPICESCGTAVWIKKTLANTDCENCPVKRCLSYSMAAEMQKYMYPTSWQRIAVTRKLKARTEILGLIHSASPQPAVYRLIQPDVSHGCHSEGQAASPHFTPQLRPQFSLRPCASPGVWTTTQWSGITELIPFGIYICSGFVLFFT